jgi:SAM-dependent methyltransferase
LAGVSAGCLFEVIPCRFLWQVAAPSILVLLEGGPVSLKLGQNLRPETLLRGEQPASMEAEATPESSDALLLECGDAVVLVDPRYSYALGRAGRPEPADADADGPAPRRLLMTLRMVMRVPEALLQWRTHQAAKPAVVALDFGVLPEALVGCRAGPPNVPAEEEDVLRPPPVEQRHVQEVYETIAAHWDRTRHSPWPKVEAFLRSLPAHSLVADVGCGNGKYMLVAPDHVEMVGSDVCVNLVRLCQQKGLEVAVCDNMNLPYRDGAFDAAISIAVLHHFSTVARRRRALAEVCRIVRPGGQILVQAWALEQVRPFALTPSSTPSLPATHAFAFFPLYPPFRLPPLCLRCTPGMLGPSVAQFGAALVRGAC